MIYLCRMFDRLQRGEDYAESGCAIHIGILDFTLFEEVPEFYACYKMLNAAEIARLQELIAQKQN